MTPRAVLSEFAPDDRVWWLDLDPLVRAVQHIDKHPEQWDQKLWLVKKPECGTVGCVAGWTVALHPGLADRLLWKDDEVWDDAEGRFISRPSGRVEIGVNPDLAYSNIDDAAYQLLLRDPGAKLQARLDGSKSGFYAHPAWETLEQMFYGGNDRRDVQDYLEDLFDLIGEPCPVDMPEWAKSPGVSS